MLNICTNLHHPWSVGQKNRPRKNFACQTFWNLKTLFATPEQKHIFLIKKIYEDLCCTKKEFKCQQLFTKCGTPLPIKCQFKFIGGKRKLFDTAVFADFFPCCGLPRPVFVVSDVSRIVNLGSGFPGGR